MNKIINNLELSIEDNIILEKYNTIYSNLYTLNTALECIE